MDQSNHSISENLPLGRLVENALGELERSGYSRRSLDRYRAIWEHFIEFSRQRKLGDEFSGNLAARFVEEYRMGDEEVDKPGEGWRRHIVFGVKALEVVNRRRGSASQLAANTAGFVSPSPLQRFALQ